MKAGPVTTEQLQRLSSVWKQGQHVLITGPTQSGKTTLARHILQKRIDNGGSVVMFVCKLRDDETVMRDYGDWTRWTEWHRSPKPFENRVLLWPKTDKLPVVQAMELQKRVFSEALDKLSMQGKWTVYGDEGLYMCDSQFLGLGRKWAMMHALGASAKLTLVTSTQRPANIPKIIYGSATHAITGRVNEQMDLARLAELQGRESKKQLAEMLSANTRNDFVWSPIGPDWPAERMNLAH